MNKNQKEKRDGCTSLNRNSMQMRDRLDRMARNLEKKIMNLGQLVRSDPRISTPLDRRPSKIWNDVIEGRGLIIGIDRLMNQRYPKSRGHYRRSNDVLFTRYPTLYKLSVSVSVSGVNREIRLELSDQGSWRRRVNVQQRQLAPMLKFSPNRRVKLI